MGRPSNTSASAVYFEDCEAKAETAKAIKVFIPDAERELWIPKSQVHDDSEVYRNGDSGTLAITAWFAEKEGLV